MNQCQKASFVCFKWNEHYVGRLFKLLGHSFLVYYIFETKHLSIKWSGITIITLEIWPTRASKEMNSNFLKKIIHQLLLPKSCVVNAIPNTKVQRYVTPLRYQQWQVGSLQWQLLLCNSLPERKSILHMVLGIFKLGLLHCRAPVDPTLNSGWWLLQLSMCKAWRKLLLVPNVWSWCLELLCSE